MNSHENENKIENETDNEKENENKNVNENENKNKNLNEDVSQRINWKKFVTMTKAKAEAHDMVAQYWHKVHTYLGLVLVILSAITTVLAAIETVPKMVTVGASGVTTLLTTINGFLKPSDRKETESKSAKEFRSLSLRMIRCENDHEYERLWQEYDHELLGEPFLPEKFKKDMKELEGKVPYSITPELDKVIKDKEKALGLRTQQPGTVIDVSPENTTVTEGSENQGFC